MKKLIFSICVFSTLIVQAQSEAENFYNEGLTYLKGISKDYDLNQAKYLLKKASDLKHVDAMLVLGDVYKSALNGNVNKDSVLFWYTTASNYGSVRANYKLGKLYKEGKLVPQDFAKAVKYYQKGVLQNDDMCKNALAYMYYKGLGIGQDYFRAYSLYKESAKNENKNSMYFLGLCYKNGYGVNRDTAIANFWLRKSAKEFERQAGRELNEWEPENRGLIDPVLQSKLNATNGYKEKYIASSDNNYEGNYKGFAIYYDWSGKFVHEIIPLELELKKDGQKYTGTWKEEDRESVKIIAINSNNKFVFNNTTPYLRKDHYSGRSLESWRFRQAKLNLNFVKDSVELNGFIQFYSFKRREPGKPVQIAVKKSMSTDGQASEGFVKLKLFPNPATNNLTVQFSLAVKERVAIRVLSKNGKVLFTEDAKNLPAGTYIYPMQVGNLAAGVYDVQIIRNKAISSTSSFVKE